MTAHNNVPDPDRGDEDQVNTSEMPQIFQNGDSEDSDEDETPSNNGYEMIHQEEHEDDEDEDSGLSMEEQVAALVRAAHADQNNLSDGTRDMIAESSESHRRETVAESARVWSEVKPREDSIKLDDEKVETIKSLMSNIKLPQIPVWAAEIGDDVWKEKFSQGTVKKS
eukprot:GFUD01003148.1.p1 GENE.GFUD01003148.1~~GFUD01003148.1.p1  ORF type:complete len:168 (+),score=59.48 GFUD01003148.1:36-539(+)